jgi:hypothetical protein
MIDPLARAATFAARRGGMQDTQKLRRQLAKIEGRTKPIREDVLAPEEWSLVEEVDETPTADDDTVGRFFLVRNDNADDVFTAGITASDGTPILVDLSTIQTEGEAEEVLSLSALYDVEVGISGNDPWDVAVGPDGNHFVVMNDDDRVFQFTPNGGATTQFGGPNNIRPISIAVDRLANRFVLDASGGMTAIPPYNLRKFDGANAHVSSTLLDHTTLGDPVAIATTQDNKIIMIHDFGTQTKVTIWTNAPVHSSTLVLDIEQPLDVGVDIDGNIYISSGTSGTVRKYDQAGNLLLTIGLGIGTGAGQLSSPEGVEVMSDGTIMVVERDNARISAFDANGDFITSTGSYGTTGAQLKSPRKAGIDAFNQLLIADYGNHRVSIARFAEVGEASAYPMQDDFIGGNTTTGSVGELGWNTNGGGSLSVAASTAAHPGIYTLSSGAVSGGARNLYIGPWLLPNIRRMVFYFKTGGNLGNSTMFVGLGSDPNLQGNVVNDGVIIREFDAGVWSLLAYDAGVNLSNQSFGISPTASTWYQVILERTNPGEITATLREMPTSTVAQLVATGIPEDVGLSACARVRANSANARTLDFDYWSGTFDGISRV